jgi:hypothetical protein
MARYWMAGLAVLVVLAYIAFPYVTIWQLNQAVNARDEAALERLVDWESLSGALEADLNAQFQGVPGGEGDPMAEAAANLMGIFAELLVAPVVAFYASPEGLVYLLNGQVILDDPGEAFEPDFPAEDTWFDHIDGAFFGGPAMFRVRVEGAAAHKDGEEDFPLVLEFRFQSFKWQLTRVYLPLDDIAN